MATVVIEPSATETDGTTTLVLRNNGAGPAIHDRQLDWIVGLFLTLITALLSGVRTLRKFRYAITVGFTLVASAFLLVLNGSKKCKFAWLPLGTGVVWVLDVVRIGLKIRAAPGQPRHGAQPTDPMTPRLPDFVARCESPSGWALHEVPSCPEYQRFFGDGSQRICYSYLAAGN